MQKIIVDSSVILKWLYREDELYLDQADSLLKDAVESKVKLITSELAKYVVGNVLLVAKKLPIDEGKEVLETLYTLPILFIALSDNLSHETFTLGNEAKISYYDAAFAALAKQEDAVLVTDDPKHQAKISKIKVLSLEKYK